MCSASLLTSITEPHGPVAKDICKSKKEIKRGIEKEEEKGLLHESAFRVQLFRTCFSVQSVAENPI